MYIYCFNLQPHILKRLKFAKSMCTLRKIQNPVCVSYLGGIKWMPHSSPEDGLGGIFPYVSQLSHTDAAAEHNLQDNNTLKTSSDPHCAKVETLLNSAQQLVVIPTKNVGTVIIK